MKFMKVLRDTFMMQNDLSNSWLFDYLKVLTKPRRDYILRYISIEVTHQSAT